MANKNLNAAKTAKKDEFYTQLTDIEREMQHYWKHFRGKTYHTIRPSHIIHVTLFPRSFRGFWLNANNSECFIYQQCNGLA